MDKIISTIKKHISIIKFYLIVLISLLLIPIVIYGFNIYDNIQADRIYKDDKLIIADDKIKKSRFDNYNDSNNLISCKVYTVGSIYFNGISSKINTTTTMDYDIELISGDFKIVSISPDNKVTTLVEGSGSGTVEIPLGEGINIIKFVGRRKSIANVSIHINNIYSDNSNATYTHKFDIVDNDYTMGNLIVSKQWTEEEKMQILKAQEAVIQAQKKLEEAEKELKEAMEKLNQYR